jgi:cation diffusion facilitator CzcD-associated flavoprotein CzcO
MRPLRVYSTVRTGDVIRVLPGPPVVATPAAAASTEHVVIVGAGAAGSFAAAELRRIGFAGRVTLLTGEDRLPYDKPNLSKDYLGRIAAVATLFRDDVSLAVEAAMEHNAGDDEILEIVRRAF